METCWVREEKQSQDRMQEMLKNRIEQTLAQRKKGHQSNQMDCMVRQTSTYQMEPGRQAEHRLTAMGYG